MTTVEPTRTTRMRTDELWSIVWKVTTRQREASPSLHLRGRILDYQYPLLHPLPAAVHRAVGAVAAASKHAVRSDTRHCLWW